MILAESLILLNSNAQSEQSIVKKTCLLPQSGKIRYGIAVFSASISSSMMLLGYNAPVLADDYFDPAAIELSDSTQKMVDLHYFSNPGGQLPGRYPVTVWVNNQLVARELIEFIEADGVLHPLLTPAKLAEYGVNVSTYPAFAKFREGETFTDIGHFIPDASSTFDFANQQLNLSIPQIAMEMRVRGYVNPALWDDGIAAAFVDYTLSGAQTQQINGNMRSDYLNLRNGINLNAWRFRNISAMQYDKSSHWRSQSTFLQHDVRLLKSQLRIGDTYTNGDIFSSVQFRGVRLMSEEDMLPDSQRGFAPIIRGMAHSNARVTVSQHGYIIYETHVAPGEFAIRDLYPTVQSGDLEVTVKESDGSERKFTQPLSSIPFMQRQDQMKYSVSIGRYYPTQSQPFHPQFIQATLFYGLSAESTLYGGSLLAHGYQSWSAGLGHGFGEFGSLGINFTNAVTHTSSTKRYIGDSTRVQYQKAFPSFGSTLSLASYNYSSGGYYEFGDANVLEGGIGIANNKRTREELSLSQTLSDIGNLSVSAWTQTYWHTRGYDETIHVGFYSAWKGVSWGVGYYYIQSSDSNKSDRSFSFNLNIPMSDILPDSNVNYSITSDKNGYTAHQVSLNGSMLENKNLYYNVQQDLSNQVQRYNSSVSLDYHGGYGETQFSYSRDKIGNRLTWGGSGAIVAHPNGITFGQYAPDSFAIVRAPGATNVEIENGNNLHTDWRGYAIVPALIAYRKNYISLNPETLANNTDIDQKTQIVIPSGGAIVEADYHTHIGSRVIFNLRNSHGALPFGASAHLLGDDTAAHGIITEHGQVYLSGIPDTGNIEVNWIANNVTQFCTTHFHLPDAQKYKQVKVITAECL
ncbi:fimbria/pilus outer membrane usher protein [Citrobacter portucalensis]|uniref:fimbria/pilus outer membrane usher protein n=1 Tax=Citrobacter portucalensis TaxID=1639133 RepID=UPI00397ABD72